MPYARKYGVKKRKYTGKSAVPRRAAPKSKRSRGKMLPSRVRVSSMRYQINRQITQAMSNVSESKFHSYAGECLNPQSKPAGAQPMSYVFLNAGTALVGAPNSMFVPMDLFNFPKGDSNVERNGDYMYIKKAHVKFEVQMLPQAGLDFNQLNSTTEFRMMIVKANRKYNKLGNSPVAGNSLFLTTTNDDFGFGVPGGVSTASVFANMQQPIDKRRWLVYKDQRFTLSTPAQEYGDSAAPQQFATNTSNPHYPVKKYLNFDFPIYKKCHFDSAGTVPDNVDTQFLIVLQATRTSYCLDKADVPRNYRVNVLATTSASDN
ncbi:MAG: putative capsid protein [Circoviridae sp.]|nr:MAG: putative capsid protein [Circoviridae sp.]